MIAYDTKSHPLHNTILLCRPCSPYQVVTGKIYHLKQHFLLRATAWRFTKIKLWSDPIFTRIEMNECIWKSTKIYRAFVFMGHSFWKENIEERVKLLESKVFNCCRKITTADLWKIGVKMREWHFGKLLKFQARAGHCPPPPLGKCTFGVYFLPYQPWMVPFLLI